MRERLGFLSAGLLALILAGCGDTTSPDSTYGAQGGKAGGGSTQSGTTLSATKTATGYMEQEVYYTWDIEKSVDSQGELLKKGDTSTLTYTLNFTKSEASRGSIKTGVRGEICVTNGGGVATQGLSITDVLMSKTGSAAFQPKLTTAIPTGGELAAGETRCYQYDIPFTPVTGETYKNTVNVTIKNHSGWLPGGTNCPGTTPCDFGPSPSASFTMPGTVTEIPVNGTAVLKDLLACPTGFTCAYLTDPNGMQVTATGSLSYQVQVTNNDADCSQTFQLNNTASIVSLDGQTVFDSASASVPLTPMCTIVTGCTLTIGYWKNHLKALTDTLPVTLGTTEVSDVTVAVNILQMQGDASNGINKLMAQLLATKLNIKAGASTTSDLDVAIAAADAFLATHTSADWSSLSADEQNTVLGWMTMFDTYNNGLLPGAPAHCA